MASKETWEKILVAKAVYGLAAEVAAEAKEDLWSLIFDTDLTTQEKADVLGLGKNRVYQLQQERRQRGFGEVRN